MPQSRKATNLRRKPFNRGLKKIKDPAFAEVARGDSEGIEFPTSLVLSGEPEGIVEEV